MKSLQFIWLRPLLFTLFSAHFLVADCTVITLWNPKSTSLQGFRCNPRFH